MIKVDRKENPTFNKYSDNIVKESLKTDFNKKCYLCEEVTRHFEVEHFYPQKYYPYLKNEYSNLFYCCQKCNKIKPKNINTNSDNEILNCCEVDVEKYIKLKLNILECKIEIIKVDSIKNLDTQIDNTITILDRIYNGTDSKSNSCEDLKNEIVEIISEFQKKLEQYQKSKLKRAISKDIQRDLDIKSSYLTFKRWIIRDNKSLNQEFKKYIID